MDYEIMMNNNLKIGMEAPDFDAVSTMGDISLSSYKGKWIIFFSHPNDFSAYLHNRDNWFCQSSTVKLSKLAVGFPNREGCFCRKNTCECAAIPAAAMITRNRSFSLCRKLIARIGSTVCTRFT